MVGMFSKAAAAEANRDGATAESVLLAVHRAEDEFENRLVEKFLRLAEERDVVYELVRAAEEDGDAGTKRMYEGDAARLIARMGQVATIYADVFGVGIGPRVSWTLPAQASQ